MAMPARLSAGENRVRGPAPRRGEHNRDVLANVLGYDDERIRALAACGALVGEEADADAPRAPRRGGTGGG